ncbi:glycosyl transferase family 2 [Mesorhizobium loti]|uniref:Glycosyl transferase family 2 n=1 Tax=Rhizobium loti TaxID=381 RepID=A0A117N2R9_RHILI|nr:glycosyl transferase family 2 [Mesorhizobium loti]
MKISFVVPAYNEEVCLPRTLEAIIAEVKRSQCAAEIIVVNNASTDKTRLTAEAYPGIVVIDEAVKGLVRARSAGYHAATGDLVANIDADTIITEGWIDTVQRAFVASPELVAMSGPLIYYDLPKHTRALVRAFYCGGYVCYLLNRYVLRVGSMMQGGNFVVRRDALARIGGFNPDFEFYGEDTELARRLSKVGGVDFTFSLPALSSGRRLLGEGVARIGLRYAMNFFWATFLKKPFTETWLDFRDQPQKPATW